MRGGFERDSSEERRLAYVGVTRAIDKLFISYSDIRTMYGSQDATGPSIFLRDVVRSYYGQREKPFEVLS